MLESIGSFSICTFNIISILLYSCVGFAVKLSEIFGYRNSGVGAHEACCSCPPVDGVIISGYHRDTFTIAHLSIMLAVHGQLWLQQSPLDE